MKKLRSVHKQIYGYKKNLAYDIVREFYRRIGMCDDDVWHEIRIKVTLRINLVTTTVMNKIL